MAATLIFFICLATSAWAQPDVEQEKIAYLVASIANLKDATFIRNGESYDAERAGELFVDDGKICSHGGECARAFAARRTGAGRG